MMIMMITMMKMISLLIIKFFGFLTALIRDRHFLRVLPLCIGVTVTTLARTADTCKKRLYLVSEVFHALFVSNHAIRCNLMHIEIFIIIMTMMTEKIRKTMTIIEL